MQAVLYGMAGVMAVAAIVARVGLRRGIHAAPDALEPETSAPPPGTTASPAIAADDQEDRPSRPVR